MNKLNHIRKFFVRQTDENDCGTACLSMILNYTGRKNDIPELQVSMIIGDDGLSLLELRNLALQFGLSAKCVKMDIGFLRENSKPCILHMVNEQGQNHFQVCYGARKRRTAFQYLMADPARQVYYLDEQSLERQWKSRAALYFDELPASAASKPVSSWGLLLFRQPFPAGLWISVPFLSICIAFFGIAVSWVLQRGINDSLAGKKNSLIFSVVFLLLLVTLFKGFFAYLRQRILIKINNSINDELVMTLVKKIVKSSSAGQPAPDLKSVKISMAEILKMQNAVSAFLSTLLSEGAIIALVLSGVFYSLPVAGVINAIYLGLVCLLTARSLPELSFGYAHLRELSGFTENLMVQEPRLSINAEEKLPDEKRIKFHRQNHARYLDFACSLAIRISKMNLLIECLGTINVILVFALGVTEIQRQQITYGSFMIIVLLSYFITVLMPRICSALFVVADGAEASLQYSMKFPEHS